MSKKSLFAWFSCFIIIFSVGCSSSDNKVNETNSSKETVSEEAITDSNMSSETESAETSVRETNINDKSEEARTVYLGIKYSTGYSGSSEKTGIEVYINDTKLGSMNKGDKRGYVVSLAPGTYTLKTVRNGSDEKKCEFTVTEDEGSIFSEMFFGYEYSYNTLTQSTKLEEADFPTLADSEYIWLSN